MLARLSVHQFRNIEHAELQLEPGIHLVVGPNAHGKTSLLEAVHLLATSKVLRGSREVEAIRHGEEQASVRGGLQDSRTELRMDLTRGKRKRAFINSLDLKRASDLIGRLPCVVFSNEDLSIVRGDPSDRREFMDMTLCQLYPAYLGHLASYKRSLEQRNALLKLASERFVADEQFESWEAELDRHGAALRSTRREFLAQLEPVAAQVHRDMGPDEQLTITHVLRDEVPVRDSLAEMYRAARPMEIRRGSSLVGPHRDELLLSVNDNEVRLFGSQGQQRTAALSLKLATIEVMEQLLGVSPILLLDDVFSELDASRRSRLLSTASQHSGQVILTCTEAEQAGDLMAKSAKIIEIRSGVIQ
ncbi:MAG: DNA replication/repair protein RecF [Chthonomonas sp.]|nr:DNA replication/repair protein RecF [Chthonomonas sp.]